MKVKSRIVRITYFLAECPVCGAEYIWIEQDFRKKIKKCGSCGNTFGVSDFPYDELGTIELEITSDGTTIREE